MKKNLGTAACAFALLRIGTAVAAESPPAEGFKAGPYIGVDVGWIGYHDNVQGYSVNPKIRRSRSAVLTCRGRRTA
jgi:hypothetical protein